jgi:hypothetical protein
MSDVETVITPPPARGVKLVWALGIVVVLLLIGGAVFGVIFARDLHNWDATIAENSTQILALKAESTRQSDAEAKSVRELSQIQMDTRLAQGPVDCATKVQVVWTIIKNRQFSAANGPLVDMVRACGTNAGSFTITVRT